MTETGGHQAIGAVTAALRALGVNFYIGGSVASSLHGVARSTVDADIVADLRPQHVSRFASLLEQDYYVDAEMIRSAIAEGSSFNVIHLATSFKVDIFLIKTRPYDQAAAQRIVTVPIAGPGSACLPIASAEDTILSKLEWFRAGGETSERQWLDVIGVMKVQAGALDRAYLSRWAGELGVSDLLEQALSEAAI